MSASAHAAAAKEAEGYKRGIEDAATLCANLWCIDGQAIVQLQAAMKGTS